MNDKPTKDNETTNDNIATSTTSGKSSINTTKASTAKTSKTTIQPVGSSNSEQGKSSPVPSSSATDNGISTSSRVARDSSDAVFGLIVLAILIALVTWAVVSVTSTYSSDITLGQLNYPSTARVGDSVSLLYEIDDGMDAGSNIEWYIDDVRVYYGSYDGAGSVEYSWQPTNSGSHRVQLRIGDSYTDEAVVVVTQPLAVVAIGDYTIQYGDPLPQFDYTIEGIYEGEDIGYCGTVVCKEQIEGIGVYTLQCTEDSCTSTNYQLQCNTGNLIVVPRRVAISNTIIKQYDGTNIAYVDDMQLEGVLEGDDVCATADMLYYSDKHAGTDKQISSYNIGLCGIDSCNYTLEGAVIYGTIVPRQLQLEGTTVEHKVYDGTNTATVSNSGRLTGVLDGDSVAIGYIDAHYNSAKIAREKDVIIDSITLVGSDSGNYTVEKPQVQGRIVAKYIDLLVGNDAVAGSSQQY